MASAAAAVARRWAFLANTGGARRRGDVRYRRAGEAATLTPPSRNDAAVARIASHTARGGRARRCVTTTYELCHHGSQNSRRPEKNRTKPRFRAEAGAVWGRLGHASGWGLVGEDGETSDRADVRRHRALRRGARAPGTSLRFLAPGLQAPRGAHSPFADIPIPLASRPARRAGVHRVCPPGRRGRRHAFGATGPSRVPDLELPRGPATPALRPLVRSR